MYRFCFNQLNNASVKPMDWQRNGLTLLYPFSIVR